MPAPFAAFGKSGRNIVRGDGFRRVDLSVFRNFSLRERLKLQLRFEATNALNQVKYQGPVTDHLRSVNSIRTQYQERCN